MTNRFLLLSAIFGFLAVAIGAFGAHGLDPLLSDHAMAIYEKGVHYQFFHLPVLLGIGVLQRQMGPGRAMKMLSIAGILFSLGILFFSGSLYLLSLKDLFGWSIHWIGPITPLGGLCFLGGWAMLMLVLPALNTGI